MFRLIKHKIQEIFLANKAKNYWRNCDKWPLKDISVEIYNNQIKAVREFFIPLLQKDSSVLDLGCGDGWLSFEIAPLVCHVDAIDISEKLIHIAQETQKVNNINNIIFNVGEVDKVIDTNILYDSVMCMGLFTCVLKDSVMKKVIKQISLKLKPDGILFVRDSLNKKVTQSFVQGNYVAIYRQECYYTSLFVNEGFKLLYEGNLSDKVSDTGYFSGFKILKKIKYE